MIHDIVFLILGLLLLIGGANYVTDGAVAVARRFHVSNLMIGLTVVALGSTASDIAVCVESALENKPALAMGEVIGSNIFDLLLVVGCMGIMRPWRTSDLMRRQDLPILFIASAALWIAGDSVIFDNAAHNVIDRSAGMMLIVIFVFYMWFMINASKNPNSLQAASEGDDSPTTTSTDITSSTAGIAAAHGVKAELRMINSKIKQLEGKQWFSWLLIVGGLGALVIGGNWVVDGASGLALKIGMSQGMVALTVVAIGNALPDLITSMTATLKGACGIAFGNIVGSCIINALLSIGLSALFIPLQADTIGFVDFITLVGASALLWAVPSILKTHRIGRIFGVCLVGLYIAYMVFTVARG
ncbi:MAG: sodium:calcium antiporter [Muribaculaceae bacterium]|nr:sodium:calcium antiporter [Muribaculaceae bacterium]